MKNIKFLALSMLMVAGAVNLCASDSEQQVSEHATAATLSSKETDYGIGESADLIKGLRQLGAEDNMRWAYVLRRAFLEGNEKGVEYIKRVKPDAVSEELVIYDKQGNTKFVKPLSGE